MTHVRTQKTPESLWFYNRDGNGTIGTCAQYYWFGNSVIHSTDLDLFNKGQNGSYGHITSKKSSGFHSVNQFTHKAPPLRVPSWPPFLPPSPPYPSHHPWRDIKGGSGVSGSGSSWVFHSCPQSIPFTLDQSRHSIKALIVKMSREKLVRPQIFVSSPQMSWKKQEWFLQKSMMCHEKIIV